MYNQSKLVLILLAIFAASSSAAQTSSTVSEGEELKLKIEAQADRDRIVMLAEARRTSAILRGEGEGRRNIILGEAYGQDAEFFAFYRSMQAYRRALDQDDTTMVLSPESEFFRFFGDMTGGK